MTSLAPTLARAAHLPEPGDDPDHAAKVDGFLRRMVLVTILAQRFALPAGSSLQIPLMQVLLLVFLVDGITRGILVFRTRMTIAYLVLVAALLGVTLAHSLLGFDVHPTSVGYLVVLYLPMMCKLAVDRPRLHFERMVTFFVRVMTWLGAGGLALFLAQFAGLGYQDWLGLVVPSKFLQQGYNTSYGITFGSSIFRNNGVVFLEASFCSAFLAVAFLGALFLHEKPWRLALFAVCLVSTVSGNGIVVILVAVLTMLVTGNVKTLGRAAVPFAAVMAVGAATPVGAALLARVTEGSQSNSSTSLRMIVPYQLFLPRVAESGPLMLLGHGAGSIDDSIKRVDLIYPLIPKMLYDYGAPIAVGFLVFVLAAVRSRHAWRPITVAMLAIWIYVGAGLLDTTQVSMLLLFAAWWPTTGVEDDAPDAVP
ncbi:MAG: hypothetical protein JWR42_1000 [Marmoricola sp.]|nr:hypothetical protein [Marmoricola sp.]